MAAIKSYQAKQFQEDRFCKQLLPVIPSNELPVLLAYLIPWVACGGVKGVVLFGYWQSREANSVDCWIASTEVPVRLAGQECCGFMA